MNDDQQQNSQTNNQSPPPPKEPEFQLGGVSRTIVTDDDELDTQSPPVAHQTLVLGLQDEDKPSDDPAHPGKTTLVIGQEYQHELKNQKPIDYTSASQQAAKVNKLSPLIKAIIALGVLVALAGLGYTAYINFFTI